MQRRAPPPAREIAAVFAALSQETRLEAYRLLLRYQPFGLAAGDISRLLSIPHNTLSTHLRNLEISGLVHSRKEGRSVIYIANTERFKATATFLGLSDIDSWFSNHTSPAASYPSKRPVLEAPDHICNVLILCSANSARSLMAEAIVNREGYGKFRAFSAGSTPKQRPNPLTIELLDKLGYDTSCLVPKSWTRFAEPGAPQMDFVISVCDRASGETCPSWPGHPLVAHWGIPSIAELDGSCSEHRAAFDATYRNLMNRFTAFINLDVDNLPLNELKRQLQAIGRIEGATEQTLRQAEI